jgi:hypothetical protein
MKCWWCLRAAPGCINCFCMGIPSKGGQASCKPSQLFRDKVNMRRVPSFLFVCLDRIK